MDIEQWSKLLSSYRNAKGWSMAKMAEALGVSTRQIARWEAGEASPTKLSIEKMNALMEGKRALSLEEKIDLLLARTERIEKFLMTVDKSSDKS